MRHEGKGEGDEGGGEVRGGGQRGLARARRKRLTVRAAMGENALRV